MNNVDEVKIEDVEPKSYLDYANQEHIAPMDNQDSEAMVTLLMSEMNGVSWEGETLENLEKKIGYRIIRSRLDQTDAKCSIPCLLFCAFLCDTPAKSVMWAYTLFRMYQKEGEDITLGKLAETFPWGFPTDDSQIECWDAQKGFSLGVKGVDNALDRPEVWGLKAW